MPARSRNQIGRSGFRSDVERALRRRGRKLLLIASRIVVTTLALRTARSRGLFERQESSLGDKQAAKQRRRENRDERDRAKTERSGESPAQKAEAIRRENEPDPKHQERREGLDGSVGGDTAA